MALSYKNIGNYKNTGNCFIIFETVIKKLDQFTKIFYLQILEKNKWIYFSGISERKLLIKYSL